MDSNNQVFLRSKGNVTLQKSKSILLKDIVEISAHKEIKDKIENLNYTINAKDQEYILVSIIKIIDFIKENINNIDLVIIGKTDVLINFKNSNNSSTDRYKIIRVALVCILLFVGSITAIVNFHSDVDMKETHSTIYESITGVKTDRPLLLQIPYSIGIGVGMSVFFNHIFKKTINNEPTPLEMEIHSYQQSVDEYRKNETHGPQ